MRPICSCCDPSVAEMVSELTTSKLSGSAPYFSWSASTLELSWVKLPVMLGSPPRMIAFIDGAEST